MHTAPGRLHVAVKPRRVVQCLEAAQRLENHVAHLPGAERVVVGCPAHTTPSAHGRGVAGGFGGGVGRRRGAVSGAICGFSVSLFAVPVDVVKINAQKLHCSAPDAAPGCRAHPVVSVHR